MFIGRMVGKLNSGNVATFQQRLESISSYFERTTLLIDMSKYRKRSSCANFLNDVYDGLIRCDFTISTLSVIIYLCEQANNV